MKDIPPIQKRFIYHPQYTQPANLKNRIICQLISSIKGRVKMYGHKDNDDCVVFEGTKAEEIHIQYLTDKHVSCFWERVEKLYKAYIDEHQLYCKEEDDNPPVAAGSASPTLAINVELQVRKR